MKWILSACLILCAACQRPTAPDTAPAAGSDDMTAPASMMIGQGDVKSPRFRARVRVHTHSRPNEHLTVPNRRR